MCACGITVFLYFINNIESNTGLIVVSGTPTDIHNGLSQQLVGTLRGVPSPATTPDVSKTVFVDWLDGIATSGGALEAHGRC